MLCSAVSPQMIQNNTGKPFSTDIYNRKTLGQVIATLKQFSYCFVNRGCTYFNLGSLIKGFYKLVSVTSNKLLVSYENPHRERHMFLYQICLCFHLISTAPVNIFLKQSLFPKVQCYDFSKKFRHNWEIRADQENVIFQFSGLGHILIHNIIYL